VILSGMDNFNITANSGSFICLSVGENIIATAEATGAPMDIAFPPQETGTFIDVVITKQNYYRYENQLEVIPPDGPYCMYKSHSLNDSLGNNNYKADFDEDIFINIGVKNLGSEDAVNVTATISTTNSFVDFIDATEVFDTILAGEICNMNNAFKIHISNAIPDQTQVRIDLTASDEQEKSWESKFFFVVSAPKLTVGEMLVDDSEFGNNNGRLDPGETADLKFKTTNKGHCIAKDVVCTLTAFNQYITVNTEEVILPTLSTFGAAYPKFNVTVAEDAPEAVMAEMHYSIASAGYLEGKAYFPKIGIFLEDWETGNFNKYEWITGGSQPFTISSETPYQGSYHAASGNINHNQKSSFMITYEVMNNDNILFYKKVSSQLDYDQLKFYINGTLRAAWSGTSQGWTQESFPVSPGTNTFKWEYSKNSSVVAGSDKAWVDYIVLPTRLVTTLFAGPDDAICENLDFQCLGSATNHATVNWTTSGTGTFSNSETLYPVYSPSEEDYQNNSVALTLNITDNDGESFSDEMILEFLSTPKAPATPVGPDYVDLKETNSTIYSINSDPDASGYSWLLEPEDAGEIVMNDTSAVINWNPDFLGEVSLSAALLNNCGTGDFSEPLMIIIDNTVGLISFDDNLQLLIAPNPNNGNFKISIKSNENEAIEWSIMNYLGVKVLSGSAQNASSRLELFINRQDLSPGMYVLVVELNGKYYSKKLLINK
ncbi:MAG TPA: T9SS type A sorting domain-containing protein, partial [Bacteroidales bacterium]